MLDAALETTRAGHFGQPMKIMGEVLAAGRSDAPYPIISPEYRKLNVDALNTIVTIRDAAAQERRNHRRQRA